MKTSQFSFTKVKIGSRSILVFDIIRVELFSFSFCPPVSSEITELKKKEMLLQVEPSLAQGKFTHKNKSTMMNSI